VTVRLKNMSFVKHDEQEDHGIGLRNISLDIIDKFSINKHLNNNRVFGIVSSGCQRQCRVYSDTLVRLWAEQNPDHRYLLCQQCKDGKVIVKRCLNDAPMSETFGDILIGNEWPSTITILKQTKKGNKRFQSVDDGSLFLFIKIYEPNIRRDLTYLECLQVQKRMPVQKMLEIIFCDVDFPTGSEYKAYIEEAERNIRDITFETSSLAEIGLHSGSNIIIRKKGPNEELGIEDVLRDLSEKHVEEPEENEHAQSEIAKQENDFELCASEEAVEVCTDADSTDAGELSSGSRQAKDEYDVEKCRFSSTHASQ